MSYFEIERFVSSHLRVMIDPDRDGIGVRVVQHDLLLNVHSKISNRVNFYMWLNSSQESRLGSFVFE